MHPFKKEGKQTQSSKKNASLSKRKETKISPSVLAAANNTKWRMKVMKALQQRCSLSPKIYSMKPFLCRAHCKQQCATTAKAAFAKEAIATIATATTITTTGASAKKQTSVSAHGTVTNDRASLDSSVYIYGLMSWVICMDDHENSVGADRIF